jgi:hypothetical protein
MKKYIGLAILIQLYALTRCPSNLGMEVILAGRAMHQGLVLYRDFPCHYGPVMPCLFWFLQPGLLGAAVVYGLFNLMTAWGIYKISGCEFAALLFLLVKPFFFGDAWNVETPMACFGLWAFYFAITEQKMIGAFFVVLAFLTKQTGAIYSFCLL